jgi:hypothetical protein
MSQLFCEAVALSILGGDFECILDRVSLYSLGELDAHFLSAGEFGVGLRLQVLQALIQSSGKKAAITPCFRIKY